MVNFFDSLQLGLSATTQSVATSLPRIALSLVVFVLGLIVADISRRAIFEHLSHRRRGNRISIGLAQIVFIGITIVAIMIALAIMGIDAGSLVAGLGLTSLAIGFAMRDILENTTAGLLLSFTQPFAIGDWIHIGDVEGSVVDMTVHVTRIKTASGTEIRLPNRTIYTSMIENKTAFAERRLSVELPLAPGSDMVASCTTAALSAASVPGVLQTPPANAEVFLDPGGALHMRVFFWIDSHADASRLSTQVISTLYPASVNSPVPNS